MADYGTRKTDEAVKRVERRLRRIYKEAQRDMAEKLKAWQEAHRAREAKYRRMVAEGKMSQADFDAWMRGQVFQDKQWQARKAEIDKILLNADKVASGVINDGKIGVFADNANYIGYELEQDFRVNIGFTLYDEGTVTRLIKDDPQILPKPREGVVKDKAYPFYNRLMSSAIAQGIVQGEDIQQIAKRIIDKTGERSYSSAVRNARTAYTGAQNAGRIEGLHQAQELGIQVKKKWMATLDDRTRDAHRDLDGQCVNVDEPFITPDGDEIMYPGAPNAAPELVYNCRCTLVYVYPEYDHGEAGIPRRDNITGEIVPPMTYREWEQWKLNKQQADVVSIGEPHIGDQPEQAKTHEDKPEEHHVVVEGTDISQTWHRRPDEFVFEIEDVINAQGFDGLPRVVDRDEFERAVQESGFIAQRTYSAPDQETLDAYSEQLYNGKWYVDCSTGGASFGQGMYGVSRNGTSVSDAMRHEMEVYQEISERKLTRAMTGEERFTYMAQKIKSLGYDEQKTADLITIIGNQSLGAGSLSEAMDAFGRIGSDMDFIDEVKAKIDIADIYEKRIEPVHRVETFTIDKSARTIEYDRLQAEYQDYLLRTGQEIGSSTYAAMMGYDAIIAPAEFSGASGATDYVVVLNRTVCIFRRG